jgi:GNAT superfamily N-acetyltransferase
MHGDEALVRLSELNVAEATREHARWCPPSQIQERDDVLFAASGVPYPSGPFNSVIGIGSEGVDAVSTLETAEAWFGERNRDFTVYVRSHVDHELADRCEWSGYPHIADAPGMALTDRPKMRPLLPGVVIRDVRDLQGAAHFVDVVAAAYEASGMPAQVTRKLFSRPERLLEPHLLLQVLYAQDEPLAAVMLLHCHAAVGAYWFGTVPSVRGRGHADAIVRAGANAAFDRGARVILIQASTMAEPLYARFGFRVVTRYPTYLLSRTS